ncbi:hypothetical protein Pcinc_026401 [Petrolisthes cinctipes]|uniref:Uncharacterized protein n=1 Tax=Petrolisthes cinctipes TaxID=88211 RepID=A0AAE1F6Y0_PETCI|nr:hypothetical protein Pcinc_026401 [Petrolisthes cinctipes]
MVTGELRRAWRVGGHYGRTLTRAGYTQEPSTSTTTTNIALASNTALAPPPPSPKRRQSILDSAETKDALARISVPRSIDNSGITPDGGLSRYGRLSGREALASRLEEEEKCVSQWSVARRD